MEKLTILMGRKKDLAKTFAVVLLVTGMFAANSVSLVGSQLIPDGTTVALWHMDEGSGNTVFDATSDNNDGTISGANWTTGKYGGGLYFHGGGQFHNGDGVTAPNSVSLDITGPFTVEAWIKAKGTDNYLAIVDKYYSDQVSINNGFTLLLSAGRLRFTVYSGTTAGDVLGTSDLRDDSWHHVAGIWDGNNTKVYVDKKQEGNVPWASPPASTTANLGIGKRLSGWGGYMPFLGTIDEVRISTVARDKVLVINVPTDYPTIQGAVDAAFPNNIIHVWNGTYFENIIITTSDLKLIGQSKRNTIIDGMGVGDVIFVTNADNVEIMEFTLVNSGPFWPMSAIYLNYSSGNTIWHNYIWGNVDGVTMIHSYDNDIRGNEISENYYGIWAGDSSGSSIVANNITYNSILNLDLSNCSNLLFYNNIINPSPGQVDEWPPLRNTWDDGGVHRCSVCGLTQWRGNYWSDYAGVDNGLGPPTPSGHKCGNDRIGDTAIPHMPTTGSPPSDWYPLMNLWTPIMGDVDLDGDVDIFDVVIVAGCYGATWSNANWDPRADLAPSGKIDIFDVVSCTGQYGRSDL